LNGLSKGNEMSNEELIAFLSGNLSIEAAHSQDGKTFCVIFLDGTCVQFSVL